MQYKKLTVIISLVVLGLDQWSKYAILKNSFMLPRYINEYLNLVFVGNPGVSFGLFPQASLGGALLICLLSLFIVYLFIRLYWKPGGFTAVVSGMVAGGALGNIIDRLRFGEVIDFIDVHYGARHWPAFNIADSMIVSGVLLLLMVTFIKRRKK